MDIEKKSNRIFGNELKYLKEILETDFRTSAFGMMANRFEKAFAEKIGVNYAIGHNSGTTPLHSMLEAIGVAPGNEVIVSPLTMAAPTYAIINLVLPFSCKKGRYKIIPAVGPNLAPEFMCESYPIFPAPKPTCVTKE